MNLKLESQVSDFILNENSSEMVVLSKIVEDKKKHNFFKIIFRSEFSSERTQNLHSEGAKLSGFVGNFLIFERGNEDGSEIIEQIDFSEIFRQIVEKKRFEVAKLLILRFLGGSKNRQSKLFRFYL